MDFNFQLKFDGEKNGEKTLVLALIILIWYPVMGVLSLVGFLGGIGLMSLIGLVIAAAGVYGAYEAAFFHEKGRALLQLINLVNLVWTVLSFIVGIIRGGFSFSGLLSCIINCAITCAIVWYLEQKKALFDN